MVVLRKIIRKSLHGTGGLNDCHSSNQLSEQMDTIQSSYKNILQPPLLSFQTQSQEVIGVQPQLNKNENMLQTQSTSISPEGPSILNYLNETTSRYERIKKKQCREQNLGFLSLSKLHESNIGMQYAHFSQSSKQIQQQDQKYKSSQIHHSEFRQPNELIVIEDDKETQGQIEEVGDTSTQQVSLNGRASHKRRRSKKAKRESFGRFGWEDNYYTQIEFGNQFGNHTRNAEKSVISIASDSDTSIRSKRNETHSIERCQVSKSNDKKKQNDLRSVFQSNQLQLGSNSQVQYEYEKTQFQEYSMRVQRKLNKVKRRYEGTRGTLRQSLARTRGLLNDQFTFETFMEISLLQSEQYLSKLKKELVCTYEFYQYRISRIHICGQIGRGGAFSTKKMPLGSQLYLQPSTSVTNQLDEIEVEEQRVEESTFNQSSKTTNEGDKGQSESKLKKILMIRTVKPIGIVEEDKQINQCDELLVKPAEINRHRFVMKKHTQSKYNCTRVDFSKEIQLAMAQSRNLQTSISDSTTASSFRIVKKSQ